MSSPAPQPSCFVALDLHKHYLVVGAVDAKQQVVMPPQRITLVEFATWAPMHLSHHDAVVLEATTTAWRIYDLLHPLVATVTVANPLLVKLIAAARVKTDKRDTITLARLLAAQLIPEVGVPPHPVRELRGLLAHRRRLINQRRQAQNRLHSVLHRLNIAPPDGDCLALRHREWWSQLALSSSNQLRVQHDLALLEMLDRLLGEVDRDLAQLSTQQPWADQVPLLLQLLGIGLIVAMTLLAAIGDITRFPTAKQLVGYSGLGARVHQSGQTQRGGGITKQGRREIRAVMVEAAWRASANHPYWQAQCERLKHRIGPQKASVAIARKLLVVVWHVLTKQEQDQRANAAVVARKFMHWAARHRLARRLGIARTAFVRRYLDQLQLGDELESVYYEGRHQRLPPSQVQRSARGSSAGCGTPAG